MQRKWQVLLVTAVAVFMGFLDEALQAVGEHVAGDAEVGLEVVEATHAEEGVADHEQGPAVAQHL